MSVEVTGRSCGNPTRDNTGRTVTCQRPARERGGLCTPCWMALTALERSVLEWEETAQLGLPTTDEARTVRDLDALFNAPAYRQSSMTNGGPMTIDRALALARDVALIVFVAAYLIVQF